LWDSWRRCSRCSLHCAYLCSYRNKQSATLAKPFL
jgi:hypothetical protein